ncbi:hypothetical protein CDL12_19934 [Handroanthus impetiginosus]|uniref:Uncharacterized protein n=1 Tax=Handroanthus impetiginosus TaxID=429701 RepID=A0A2G9GQA7_9LAMI|nr:hypothetical protein CDL12_19934 [Handroanthus impetiginosus]
MSLHLGNLSSRTRRDELERAFRRFGRCTIQVRDKYGFVVYDYPASAEKALKSLRGKRICGEALTLSWSKRQPQALHRFARGGKAYEPSHRKYTMKENVDYAIDSKQADVEGRKLRSSDLIDESTSYHLDGVKSYMEERNHPSNDTQAVEAAGKKHLEDDRWGEHVVDPSSENCLEYGIGFDRYEPYHSDEQNELEKHHSTSPLAISPTARKSLERRGTGHNGRLETSDHPYNPESEKTCYVCGEVGHMMRKCPFDPKKHKSSRVSLPPHADSIPLRHQESDRKPFTSRNHQRFLRHGDSPPPRTAPGARINDFRHNKRNKREYESQVKNYAKRARGSSSSSLQSDYTSFRSQSPSRSLKSSAQSPPSHSNSKSVTLKKNYLSSSRPSASQHTGSKPFTSGSASRSISPTFSSLPAEVDWQYSPSPDERQPNFKDSMVNVGGLAHCEDLSEGKTMVRSSEGASMSENITDAMENEFEVLTKLEEEEMEKDLSGKDDEHCHYSHAPLSDDGDQTADNLFLHSEREIRDSRNKDLVGEHMLAPQSDIALRSNASNSTRISSEELRMALKHYGLQYPEETEKDLPVEIYFGSARSWPWEIIYYRRLKKGPISAENNAQRVSQNEEFGIVDKYIRGSSGWSETNEENP